MRIGNGQRKFVYSLEEAAMNAQPLKNSGHVTRAKLYSDTKEAGWIELFYYKTRLNAKTQVTTKAVLTLLDGSTVSTRFSYALDSVVKRNNRVIELGPTPVPTTLLTSPAVSHSGLSFRNPTVQLKPMKTRSTEAEVVVTPTYLPLGYYGLASIVSSTDGSTLFLKFLNRTTLMFPGNYTLYNNAGILMRSGIVQYLHSFKPYVVVSYPGGLIIGQIYVCIITKPDGVQAKCIFTF